MWFATQDHGGCGRGTKRTWDSKAWVDYYRYNAEHLDPVPWDKGAELTHQERSAISASVQDFQLGESSEGHHLQRCADAWSEQTGDVAYATAIRMFTKEEQRHAACLARFLEQNGIGLIQKSWTDSLFRRVRRMAGLELSIRTLLAAEIVAQVYYVALMRATKSEVLQAICRQILKDEAEHVRFQCERLAILSQSQRPGRKFVRSTFQYVLMAAVLPVVWIRHRRAYIAGGYHFGSFTNDTWRAFQVAMSILSPESYDWQLAPQ
jgi:hypothetical protein